MTRITRILAGLALLANLGAMVGAVNSAFAATTPQPCATTTCTRPAPGPIAGAGLPMLAIGLGAYWLVMRFRRKTN
jgi:hypothetical protein